MENQLNSSGKISQDSPHWKFFTEFNTIRRIYALNRKNSVIESSLCPCSTTRHLQERQWGFLYFDVHQSSRICFKIVCVKGYWAFIGPGNEDKWFRRYDYKPERKMGLHCFKKMVKQFKETGHPVFKGTSALNRGKCVEGKTKTPFMTMENLSLWSSCYRIMHTANQLCVFGAVAGKNGIRESVEKSEHEHWGNQFFGEDTTSATSLREPNASETLKFWVSFSEKSTRTSLWKSNISSSSGEDSIWVVLVLTMDAGNSSQCAENTLTLVNFLDLGVSQRSMRIP